MTMHTSKSTYSLTKTIQSKTIYSKNIPNFFANKAIKQEKSKNKSKKTK